MSSKPQFETFDVLGIPVSATDLERSNEALVVWSKDSNGRLVFIRDVHGVMQAQSDADLMRLHREASLVTPDGMPLVWLGKSAGHNVSRTCGPDLMEYALAASVTTGLTHYFYGGKPGIAEKLKEVFETKYPGLSIVGVNTPPFRPLTEEELSEVAKAITESGAAVVWIGLSTPKQEKLMSDLVRRTPATLIGVGATFDFHTGAFKRAPIWMQKRGFEWLWRLCSEPKRLWRRYLIMAPAFVWQIIITGTRRR